MLKGTLIHILEIQEFLGFLEKIGTYRFNGSRQCYNDQAIKHFSFTPCCVKCTGKHLSDELTNSDPSQLLCVNCGGNHIKATIKKSSKTSNLA